MLWLRSAFYSLASLLLLSSVAARAQKVSAVPWVTRGAYLQLATPTSMVVRWQTAQATSARVHYGLKADQLDGQTDSPGRLARSACHQAASATTPRQLRTVK